MNRAVVFLNGDLTDLSQIGRYIDPKTYIIACDGGARHANTLGLTPNVVIGDLDSIPKRLQAALEKRGVEFKKYPTDKIHTDSELGVALAVERGCEDIILAGVRGTATDHFVANLFMLAKKKFQNVRIRIVEGKEIVELVRKKIRLEGKKGDDVSLIPIGPDVLGVSTKGLFYPLKNDVLRSGSARGVRNKMTGKNAVVALKSGALLVVHRRG